MSLQEDVAALQQRVAALEQRVRELEAGRRLLRSWAEITAWTRLGQKQLRRYMRNEGAPICRLGRHVRLEPSAWATWMMAREPHQVARRAARQAVHVDVAVSLVVI